MRLLFFEVNEVFDQQHLSRNICVNNGYKILLSFSPKEITLMRSFRSLSRFINADSSRNFTPLRGELSFLFFFSFFFFLLLGGFYGFGKTCIQKAAMRSIVKAKKEYNERSTSRLSTLFLKQSRKEKKSRDERRHESVMDRERVKEETASRGDRERDRERQERERERHSNGSSSPPFVFWPIFFRCQTSTFVFVQHSFFFSSLSFTKEAILSFYPRYVKTAI